MTEDLLGRFYAVAREKAEGGEAWDAICATMYADVLCISAAMEGADDAALDGQALAATPIPAEGDRSAKALVDRMREILTGSIPVRFRPIVEAALAPTDFLAGLDAPATEADLRESLSGLTKGLRPHPYKLRKASDAKVHARAAARMEAMGVDEVDIVAARWEADFTAFEAASMDFAFNHGDWSLEGHRVRLAAALTAVAGEAPENRTGLRAALSRQFDGLEAHAGIEWPEA